MAYFCLNDKGGYENNDVFFHSSFAIIRKRETTTLYDVTKSWLKIIAESPHSWKKRVFMVAHSSFYFWHAIFVLMGHRIPLKQ